MNKEEEEEEEEEEVEYITIGGILAVLFIFAIIIVFSFSIFAVINFAICESDVQVEYIVFKGKIIETDMVLDEDGSLEYLNLTLKNNTGIYFINAWVPYTDDLTVNSNLIVQFKEKRHHDMFFWNPQRGDDIWNITEIIKVPSEEE